MDIAAVAQVTESKSKPLGAVSIECHYPVVALALKEILKHEADVYEVRKRPPGTEDPACILLCPNGKDVASEVRRLKASTPDVAVLLFDMRVDQRLVQKALLAGASGFLHAGMRPEQIVRAVRHPENHQADSLPSGCSGQARLRLRAPQDALPA